jgi:predicted lipid-binding transport protein (Tim44 family)
MSSLDLLRARLSGLLARHRWLLPTALGVAAALAMVFFVAEASARPGSGQSYSGGSRSSSGGGGGGGGDGLLSLLIWLAFEYPIIGVPLLLGFIGYTLYARKRGQSRQDWSTGQPHFAAGPPPFVPSASARKTLEGLRGSDPNFSLVLFEDFAAFLYGQVHEARGRGGIDELAPYVTDSLRAQLRPGPGLRQVKGIVIGAMRFTHAALDPVRTTVTIEFEANLTEVTDRGEQASYVVERWTLVRRTGAQSKPPASARTLGCPNCGALRTALRGSLCTHCGGVVGDGAFDWNVQAIILVRREPRPPLLTGTVEERGNDLATIIDPQVHAAFASLQQKDPAVAWPALRARIELVFRELQIGWSTQDLSRSRPFVTDNLFQSLWYQVDTYRRSNLRNVTEKTSVANVVLARVTSDRYYDAVTVRVFATGLDYTLDAQGRVVAGHRSRMRPYTEYWTFIRGSDRRGSPRSDPACPNCGGALAVNMAGTCAYCNAIVTTGQFDWVLSRIEQDEAYEG